MAITSHVNNGKKKAGQCSRWLVMWRFGKVNVFRLTLLYLLYCIMLIHVMTMSILVALLGCNQPIKTNQLSTFLTNLSWTQVNISTIGISACQSRTISRSIIFKLKQIFWTTQANRLILQNKRIHLNQQIPPGLTNLTSSLCRTILH